MAAACSRADACSRGEMYRIDPIIVRQMEQRLECRKPEHIQERLGISLNTWDKLRLGEAIRASVALRLIKRFDEEFTQST